MVKNYQGISLKTKNITKKDIIDQYIKQGGLSTFLKLPMDLTAHDRLMAISVDRVDNDKDYEPGNITLVTRFENMGRSNNTFDEFMEFCNNLKFGGLIQIPPIVLYTPVFSISILLCTSKHVLSPKP